MQKLPLKSVISIRKVPFMLQIAAKHVYRRGEKEFAKFGSKEVECNPRFQLYLVTRAKKPRLPVEIQAVCTLVDCTMSF